MNVYDTNRIYDIVKDIGYIKTEDQKNADCYVINTCHIRDKAKEKVFHEIGRIKEIYLNKNLGEFFTFRRLLQYTRRRRRRRRRRMMRTKRA